MVSILYFDLKFKYLNYKTNTHNTNTIYVMAYKPMFNYTGSPYNKCTFVFKQGWGFYSYTHN